MKPERRSNTDIPGEHRPWSAQRKQERLRRMARAFSIDYPWETVREIPGEVHGHNHSPLALNDQRETGRIMVEGNMGALSAILRYGSDAQKQQACELVLKGDKPAICITEPNAGSAATSMESRAVDEGDHFVVNGKKHWITGGGVSSST